MSTKPIILFLSSAFFIFSCNQPAQQQDTTGARPDTSKKLASVPVQKVPEESKEPDCSRGAAEPVVKDSVFPHTHFQLQSDHLTGIETVSFDDGDQLTIHNHGCECYVLTFRFETDRFSGDTTNMAYWYPVILQLLEKIEPGIDAPVDMGKGIEKLKKYIAANDAPKLHEALDYGINEVRYYVEVERIEKITEKRFAIEVSYVVGPL
jgi:hypothetical protein